MCNFVYRIGCLNLFVIIGLYWGKSCVDFDICDWKDFWFWLKLKIVRLMFLMWIWNGILYKGKVVSDWGCFWGFCCLFFDIKCILFWWCYFCFWFWGCNCFCLFCCGMLLMEDFLRIIFSMLIVILVGLYLLDWLWWFLLYYVFFLLCGLVSVLLLILEVLYMNILLNWVLYFMKRFILGKFYCVWWWI